MRKDGRIRPGKPVDQGTSASAAANSDDIDRIGMPNISEAVSKEVERLQLDLINDVKEIINTNIDYKGIDFIPQREVSAKKIRPYTKIRDEINELTANIKQIVAKGEVGNSTEFNYVDYLNLFSVEYNIGGKPQITIDLSIDEFNPNDLRITKIVLKRRNSKTSVKEK